MLRPWTCVPNFEQSNTQEHITLKDFGPKIKPHKRTCEHWDKVESIYENKNCQLVSGICFGLVSGDVLEYSDCIQEMKPISKIVD